MTPDAGDAFIILAPYLRFPTIIDFGRWRIRLVRSKNSVQKSGLGRVSRVTPQRCSARIMLRRARRSADRRQLWPRTQGLHSQMSERVRRFAASHHISLPGGEPH
jgi:hypothetical protein